MSPISGGYSPGVPPLPIPNREVKPGRADGTAYPRESRSPPTFTENPSSGLFRKGDLFLAIYKSTSYNRQRGDSTIVGIISGLWNDRQGEREEDIVVQNNFYAHVIASMCRAWQGGGERYIDKEPRGAQLGGGVMLPESGKEYDDFAQWESRFLFHKAHCLTADPCLMCSKRRCIGALPKPSKMVEIRPGHFARKFEGLGAFFALKL